MAATSDDLVNLAAALNARSVRPDLRVVVRLFDPDFAVRVQRGFGIRFTRSVSHLAAPAFAAAAIGSEVIATIPVGDRRVVIVARAEVAEGSALDGRSVGSLDEVGARHVLAIEHPGDATPTWLPEAGSSAASGRPGDRGRDPRGSGQPVGAGADARRATIRGGDRIVRRGLASGFARLLRLGSLDRIGEMLGPRRH